MIPQNALQRYGIPFDSITTPQNEKTIFETQWMVSWDIPLIINQKIPALPNKLYCNKDLVQPLQKALETLIDENIHQELKTFDGCFNPRPIRGYEKQFKKYLDSQQFDKAVKYVSMHSWGIAIDFNAAWNQLGKIPTLSQKFVSAFTNAGFTWGGNFKRKDGMHFELN